MIKYGDLVQYIKDNHINWNTDLFDILRGFFEQYSPLSPLTFPSLPSVSTEDHSSQQVKTLSLQQELFPTEEFNEPENGEYTLQDLANLFNT